MTPEPTRREREKLRQRQEIMAAALDLFSERGYHNVSMHEIAAKAEFATGTLYKFFSNKEDLYKAMIQEQHEHFHAALTEAIESPGDEIVKLRRFVQTKCEMFLNNAPAIRLYFSETHGAGFNILAGLDQDMRNHVEEFLWRLAEIFESGIRSGRFHPIAEPYLLAVALENLSNGFLFFWLVNPEKHTCPDPDTILNILFKGLVQS